MAVKRCPLCHVVNEPSAWQCAGPQCGYRFGQPIEKSIAIVQSQLHNAYIALVGGILLALILVPVALFVRLLIFAIPLPIGMAIRGARKIGISRRSLLSLHRQRVAKASDDASNVASKAVD